ncbi:(deoxy)nucleoside triphosphate pyrophosphohydrolase [Geobacter pickeringii]|uniref:8-oxo-dGTP diphosphatase n=1 Tax=Geobacter pickeringii TaxID=345632 RepID=A0A0B5BFN9_9BACT|nr:(deoxy)nucleoside triphosphate pyrophosphohydrolase [Geobacter pickeringii]AJE03959.1 DNA mismatch repair protein MutT [Geobacter pickeringii]
MLPLIVTAAIISHGGRILLTRRKPDAPYPLLWEFPGGKLEPEEHPEACIVREVREELAMEVAVEGIYEVVYHRYPERPVMVLAYRCSWTGGELRELDVAGHCWVLPSEIPQFDLLPADIPLAERIAREFAPADTPSL